MLDFDPRNTVYTHEEDGYVLTLGNTELVERYNEGDNISNVVLDINDGEPSLAAPPRPNTRRTITTTWGSLKQK